jgi:hypothetical protein
MDTRYELSFVEASGYERLSHGVDQVFQTYLSTLPSVLRSILSGM